jgi:hypothetical protein
MNIIHEFCTYYESESGSLVKVCHATKSISASGGWFAFKAFCGTVGNAQELSLNERNQTFSHKFTDEQIANGFYTSCDLCRELTRGR